MARRDAKNRRGLTLVELLVVVVVGTFLLAASVPMLRPALEGRKIREASRQVNALFARAKARAAELGRPAGIWIERADNLTDGAQFAVRLALAEIPAPYSGDVMNAQAHLRDFNGDGRVDGALFDQATAGQLPFLVNPGDKIKFDYRGPTYTINIIRAINATQYVVVFGWDLVDDQPGLAGIDDDSDMNTDDLSELGMGGGVLGTDRWVSPPPPERPGASVPFQIFRQPVKTSAAPIDLPGGVVVDLNNSGMGLLSRNFTPTSAADFTPVVIMFQPSGSVESITGSRIGVSAPATASIHLHLGRIDQLEESELSPKPNNPPLDPTPVAFNQNLPDHRNLWVSIGHRTGMVTVAENGWEDLGSFQQALVASREFAKSAQTMGGQ